MAKKKSKRIQDPETYFGLLEYYSGELRSRQYRYLRDLRKAVSVLISDLERPRCLLPPYPFPDRKKWVRKFALRLWQQDPGLVKDAALRKQLGLDCDTRAISRTHQDGSSTHHVPPDKTMDYGRLPARYDTLSSFYDHLYRKEPQAPSMHMPLPQQRYDYQDYGISSIQEHRGFLEEQQRPTLLSASGDRKRKINSDSGPVPMYTPRKRFKLETMGDAELYNHKLAAQQQKDAARKLWEDAVIDEEMAQQEINVRSSRVPEGGSTTSFLAMRRDYTATHGNVEELEDDIM